MQHFCTDALILRTSDRGDHDQLVTVLAADFGRFYAIHKGAHSMYRKEAAATEPFTWSNIEFYEKNGVKWIRSATANETFPGLRDDPEKLFLAAYFAEIATELSDERVPAGEILSLTLNALFLLSADQADMEKIKAAFEMRAAAVSGFCPDLSCCSRCGAGISAFMYLDVMNGGLVCSDCLNRSSALHAPSEINDLGQRTVLCPLTADAIAALSFVCSADAKRIFAFQLTDKKSMADFEKAAETYLLHHLERGFPTLENYKRLSAIRRQLTNTERNHAG